VWRGREEVTVKVPTPLALLQINEPEPDLASQHFWIHAEERSTLEVCLHTLSDDAPLNEAFGREEGEEDEDRGEGFAEVSVRRDITQSLSDQLSINVNPTLEEVSPTDDAESTPNCQRYHLDHAGTYEVSIGAHANLDVDAWPALSAERVLVKRGEVMNLKAKLRVSRALSDYERFTGILPSPLAQPTLPDAAEIEVSDHYRAYLRDGDQLYLRVSTDGLGDCSDLGQDLTLRIVRADSGVVVDQGQATPAGEVGACQILLTGEAHSDNGLALGEGEYWITLTQRGHVAAVSYTLDAVIDPAPGCGDELAGGHPDDFCSPVLNLQQDWITSRLTHVARLPLYDLDQAAELAQPLMRYDFSVPTGPLQGHDPERARLTAHLSGCVDGMQGLLSVWGTDAQGGALSRQIEVAKVLVRDAASGDPVTRCQTLETDLLAGNYALTVEHLAPTPVAPLALNRAIHRARSRFPFVVDGDLHRVVMSGGRFEGEVQLRRGEPLHDAGGVSADEARLGLYWGDEALVVTPPADLAADVNMRVKMKISPQGETCTQGGLTYQNQIWLGARADELFNLTDPELAVGVISLPTAQDNDGTTGDDLEISITSAPTTDGCVIEREFILPTQTHRLTMRPNFDLSSLSLSDAETLDLSDMSVGYYIDISFPKLCGNAQVDGFEECDDGNNSNADTCSTECIKRSVCGNGIVERDLGERCDDANTDPFDGCSNSCSVCGDGILDSSEECEPTGAINDPCDARCTLRAYTSLQSDLDVEGRVIELGEEDRYTLRVNAHTWLTARTEGCEDLNANRLFDTVLTLTDGAGAELVSNDDRPVSACSEVTHYFDEAAIPELLIESYRGNDILGYRFTVD
jgi:cysteine-rich repeat protein